MYTIRYKVKNRPGLFTFKYRVHDNYYNYEYKTAEEARAKCYRLKELNPQTQYYKIYDGNTCIEKI